VIRIPTESHEDFDRKSTRDESKYADDKVPVNSWESDIGVSKNQGTLLGAVQLLRRAKTVAPKYRVSTADDFEECLLVVEVRWCVVILFELDDPLECFLPVVGTLGEFR
jgi:hypothetical protein